MPETPLLDMFRQRKDEAEVVLSFINWLLDEHKTPAFDEKGESVQAPVSIGYDTHYVTNEPKATTLMAVLADGMSPLYGGDVKAKMEKLDALVSGEGPERWEPMHRPLVERELDRERLIAAYFGTTPEAIEKERRALLDELQKEAANRR